MTDPRLGEWLARVRSILDADDAECLAHSRALAARRAELMEELRANPPAQPVPADLARELERGEHELQERLNTLLERLRDELQSLRRMQEATRGYRPEQPNRPAYVSRQV